MYSIDPDAVRGHELPVSFRGYDREKTNALLESVALAYEQALQDRNRFEARVKELEQEVGAYLAREEEFREEQSRVREQSRVLMEEVENKCRLLTENAREAAERLRKAEEETIEELRREVERLSEQKRMALEKLKTFLAAQQQVLAFYEEEDEGPAGTGFTVVPRKSADEFQRLMFDEE